ncbi:MAG: ATP-dependent Clp protease adaptor ClpS [Pelagibacterales bacterium]|nr:ATP-dependent Clp protease adaptor ClpS [Pelagibacterales bacterium]
MEKSKSNTRTKKRRRKRLSLYLLNDEFNSFEYVINILTSLLPLCNKLRGEQIAMLTHATGECEVYTGFPPEIYILFAQFQKAKLNVQLRDYSKTK